MDAVVEAKKDAPIAENKNGNEQVTKTTEESLIVKTEGDMGTVVEVKKEESIAENQNGNAQDTKKAEEAPIVKKEVVPATDQVKKRILNQMEYYFGNYNLPRDKFLKEEVQKDEGWVPMTKMLNFKRLASISEDVELILNALESSTVIEIDETRSKVRRSSKNPLPETEGDLVLASMNRTVYVKGFPKDGSVDLDVLLKFFKEHGPVETIHMRNYHNYFTKVSGFKGSILVVFPTRELAEGFLQKFDIKYKSTPLLRMWYEDYFEEKKQEIEERTKRKEERKAHIQNEREEIDTSLPKGSYLHMSNIPEGVSRDDIKVALITHTTDFAFIGFNRGDVEGYLRFKTEGCNVHMLSLLQGKLKVKDTEISLRLVEGKEEETQLTLAAEARLNSRIRPTKRPFRGGRGGGPYRGHPNKRRKF